MHATTTTPPSQVNAQENASHSNHKTFEAFFLISLISTPEQVLFGGMHLIKAHLSIHKSNRMAFRKEEI